MNRFSVFLKSVALFMVLAMLFALSACDRTADFTLAVSPTSASIGIGESIALTAKISGGKDIAVQWQSTDPAVAAVDQNGVVRGISAGQTQIRAVAQSVVAVCQVSVADNSGQSVFMSMLSAQLKVGDSITLNPVAMGGEIVWQSSRPEVASVTGGVVTGISAGIVSVFATVGGASAECRITVVEEGQTITLNLSKSQATVKQGQMLALTATPSNGESVTWLSSNPAAATINDSGVVSGISAGECIISAWIAKSSVQCKITVKDAQDTYLEGHTLVWSDEFTGDSLDTSKWGYMTGVQDIYGSSRGPIFWGNNEQQYYTQDAVSISNGALAITATRREMENGRQFSSARISTRDKAFFTYGYFEARIKTPAQNGMWPAFWMLPQPASPQNTSNKYGGWAANGEIDIMEAKGRSKYYVDTTLHFGEGGRSTYNTSSTRLNSSTEEWHVYALDWRQNSISWVIDGLTVHTVNSDEWWSASDLSNPTAPFDVDFYILLNLAVGGNYDGGTMPNDDFVSASMYVDYVRVYSAD